MIKINKVKKVAKQFFPFGKIVCENERSIIIQDKKGDKWFFYLDHNDMVVIKCYSIKV